MTNDPTIETELAALSENAVTVLPDDGLERALELSRREGRPLRVKFGVDPTGSDLTLGHAVVLRKLRQFQDAGHTAVLIVGDFTAQLGDPTGRSATRPVLTAEQTEENARTYLDQALLILSPERLEVRRNSEWLGKMPLGAFLSQVSSVTLAQILERDDFRTRFTKQRPVALSELLYPVLQALDSVEVKADVELGGTDQLFNLALGRELQRTNGQRPQVVIVTPILVGLDGHEKMSKSLGNFVALTEPATEQFGKLMSLPDEAAMTFLQLCTGIRGEALASLEADLTAGGPAAGQAKRTLARAVVELYHPGEGDLAEAAFDTQFVQHEVPEDAPEVLVPDEVHLPAFLTENGFAPSRTAARQLVSSGAVRLDDVKLTELDLAGADLRGHVLKVGKRVVVRLV